MVKELSLFCAILDRSHVLILLNIEKDLPGVTEVVPAVKIIIMLYDREKMLFSFFPIFLSNKTILLSKKVGERVGGKLTPTFAAIPGRVCYTDNFKSLQFFPSF